MAEDHAPDGPIVLFDGVCNLCSGVVRFVIRKDPTGTIRFAPLQSPAATDFLAGCGMSADQLDTFVLIEDGQCYTKSTAVLRIARHLDGLARLASLFRHIPRPIRDAGYDLVAAIRYDVFGRRSECLVPSPEFRDRFLD